MWLLCAILTFTDAFPDDPDAFGYGARTDLHLQLIHKASWFRFPLPRQYQMQTLIYLIIIRNTSEKTATSLDSRYVLF